MTNRREQPDKSQSASQPGRHAGHHEQHQRLHQERVATIKMAIANARADYQVRGDAFDPKIWVGNRLKDAILYREEHVLRRDLSLAWDAISHPYIQDKEYQSIQKDTLFSGAFLRQNNLVTLNEGETALLHAMADAVAIPFDPKQKTIDLLPTDTEKQRFRELYPVIAQKAGI